MDKILAEDGDWNTAASAGSNQRLYSHHLYHGDGVRYWKAKYSSSGSQYTIFDCYDYNAVDWINVWVETSYVNGKTVTSPIPNGCLEANQKIQLQVHSAGTAEYYEGVVLCEE